MPSCDCEHATQTTIFPHVLRLECTQFCFAVAPLAQTLARACGAACTGVSRGSSGGGGTSFNDYPCPGSKYAGLPKRRFRVHKCPAMPQNTSPQRLRAPRYTNHLQLSCKNQILKGIRDWIFHFEDGLVRPLLGQNLGSNTATLSPSSRVQNPDVS